MAGGWDGDALAGRMEDAAERAQEAEESRQPTDDSSLEERARQVKLESVRLSRARVLDQLQRATNPAYRTMLERALQALDEELDNTPPK